MTFVISTKSTTVCQEDSLSKNLQRLLYSAAQQESGLLFLSLKGCEGL